MSSAPGNAASFDLDSLGFRHPVAQGKLSFGAGVAWTVFWSVLAFATAWLVRPACAGRWWPPRRWKARTEPAAHNTLEDGRPLLTLPSGASPAVRGHELPIPGPHPALLPVGVRVGSGLLQHPNDRTDFSEDVARGIKTIPSFPGSATFPVFPLP